MHWQTRCKMSANRLQTNRYTTRYEKPLLIIGLLVVRAKSRPALPRLDIGIKSITGQRGRNHLVRENTRRIPSTKSAENCEGDAQTHRPFEFIFVRMALRMLPFPLAIERVS